MVTDYYANFYEDQRLSGKSIVEDEDDDFDLEKEVAAMEADDWEDALSGKE